MANVVGTLPETKGRPALRSLTASLSPRLRLQAELEEGHGPHRLAEGLKGLALPDQVTIVLRPTLAFLSADLCIVAPGRLLVLNALHWSGEISHGQKGEWTGAGGRVDLGRPDRRAHLFCDRLTYSGLARGFEPEPVVVFTGGPVRYSGEEPQATLVQWAELAGFLRQRLPAGLTGFPPTELIRAITPP